MTGKEKDISRFLRSREGALLIGALGLGGAGLAALGGMFRDVADASVDFGGLLLHSGLPSMSAELSLALSAVAMIAVAVMMVLVNRTFNLLRTSSVLLGGLYLLMQCSVPEISARFVPGTVLALLALIVTALLYSCYQRPERTQTVFLVFFLCTAASFAQAAALIYLPVLLAGCIQMRSFTLRTVVATILGILAPFWLMLGFHPEGFRQLYLPDVWFSPSMFLTGDFLSPLAATVAFMLVWCMMMLMHNLYRVYSYNARARALNGLMASMTVATMVLAVVCFGAPDSYLPPLMCFTAVQTALFFRINYERRSYIWVLSLAGVCAVLYIWNLWI